MKYLVVSNYPERREEMKSVLRQLDRRGHMHEARDWLQAEIALSKESRHLIFADVTGPNGQREACAIVRRYPNVALAALCDELDAETTIDLLHSGFRAVIPRELDWRSTIRALELVLLGGHYVPPQALRLSTVKPPPPATLLEASERALPYRRRLMDATALSPRQQQIMRHVHMGSTNKGIARALGISEGTVKIHLASVFRMLGATNRAAAVAIYNGWLFEQVQMRSSVHRPAPPKLAVAAEQHIPFPRVRTRRSPDVYEDPASDPAGAVFDWVSAHFTEPPELPPPE